MLLSTHAFSSQMVREPLHVEPEEYVALSPRGSWTTLGGTPLLTCFTSPVL